MRILHLDRGRTLRGGQWQVIRLIDELQREGCSQLLLTPAGSALSVWAAGRGVPHAPFTAPALREAGRDCTIAHCHDSGSHTWAAGLLKIPFAVSRRVGFAPRGSWLSRWKYARAAHFLAVSEFVRAQIEAAGVAGDRITVVYDAVPVPAVLSDRTGPLISVDTDDPRKARGLIAASGLEVYRSRQLVEDLAHASGLVYVSDMEGLGSAALLALAHGVPVVASRVGGLPEIIRHEETGLLTENDPAALRAAVDRLQREAGLAERLIRNGRALVEARHTTAALARATLAVYRKVLAE